MNIEELKLVLETLNGLGAGAKEVAYFYLAAEYVLKPLLMFAGVLSVAYFVSKVAYGMSKDEDYLRQIRDTLEAGGGGWYCSSDHKAVMEKILRLKERSK